MKLHLTAAEIAAHELPGLPRVKRAMHRFALRAGWLGRKRQARGGGVEYSIDVLPPAARAVYVAKHIAAVEVPASIARDAAAEPAAGSLTGAATESRDARLALLALADKIAADAGISRSQADKQLCGTYNEGLIEIAAWIKAQAPSITPRTLKRWRKAKREAGAGSLAVDRAKARRGTGILDRANAGAVKTFILALLAKQPQLTAHHVRALTADRFQTLELRGRAIAVPPVRTFQHALKAWRVSFRNELAAVRDPDGYKSKIRFAARVACPALRLNEVWQIDASPADVLLIDGRHSLYVVIDIHSRRMIGLVSKTPKAQAVGLLIRKAILSWGVPERIKTDNGSDFIARDTQRLFAALAIEHETAAPFRPEQKGHVERAIGTLQRGLMRTLEGFIGHSVADRKVIEGRKSFAARLGEPPEDMFAVALDAATLQQRVDDWCAHVYGQAPHAGLNGMTPFAAAAMAPGAVRRIEDVRALDMLLAPVAGKDGLRTVTKTGLRINDTHYIGGFLNVGDAVLCRMDPADMGRAYVFAADGMTYLGEAIAPELAGVDPAKAIAAVRAEQKRIGDERMVDTKKMMRAIKASDMAPAVLRQALLASGKLAEFPKPVTPHDTPALAAAAQAQADAAEPVHAPEIAALAARLHAESLAPAAPVVSLRDEETPHQLWHRARALEQAVARGEPVDAEQLLWLGEFRTGPIYRGFAQTYGVPASPQEPSQQQQA